MDWHSWHDGYDNPDSFLGRRLKVVQERIRDALDTAPPGPLRAVSVCAGQGHDLLDVLAGHPRRAEVTARLVELDPRNAEAARAAAEAAGLGDRVEVVEGDASLTSWYADLAPAHLVLMCGVFGNISDADIERTAGYCARLCASGGTLVWTRHREPPDLVPVICGWLEERGFVTEYVSDPGLDFGVAAHRFTGEPGPLARDERMFTFVGYRELRAARTRQAR